MFAHTWIAIKLQSVLYHQKYDCKCDVMFFVLFTWWYFYCFWHQVVVINSNKCFSILFVAIFCNYSRVLSIHHSESDADSKLYYQKTACKRCFMFFVLCINIKKLRYDSWFQKKEYVKYLHNIFTKSPKSPTESTKNIKQRLQAVFW